MTLIEMFLSVFSSEVAESEAVTALRSSVASAKASGKLTKKQLAPLVNALKEAENEASVSLETLYSDALSELTKVKKDDFVTTITEVADALKDVVGERVKEQAGGTIFASDVAAYCLQNGFELDDARRACTALGVRKVGLLWDGEKTRYFKKGDNLRTKCEVKKLSSEKSAIIADVLK